MFRLEKNRINCYLKKFLKIYKKIAIAWVVIIDLKQDFAPLPVMSLSILLIFIKE
ncbi:hypothetical protein I3679_004270 [Proteus mirabilis]|uniref:Uncharacterized protein n=1 Tax=Proteus mirabilis TaxID=584 RepID=A0ABD5LT95_PROMI